MKLIHRALIALALLTTGSLALADQNHGHGDRHGSQHSSSHRGGHDNRGHGDRHRNDRHDNHRRYSDSHRYRHAPPRHYRHGYRYPAPRYVVRHNRWSRGHRYYGPNYVVSNYGYYRLRPPPRGYHWVRADNDYLLVAIATGVILDIALH